MTPLPGPTPRFILNQAARMRLSARDVARAIGDPPAVVVRFDPAVKRAGEAGRLPSRGAARKTLAGFAARLLEEVAVGS